MPHFLCPCCLAVVESEIIPKGKFIRKTYIPRPPSVPVEAKEDLDDSI